MDSAHDKPRLDFYNSRSYLKSAQIELERGAWEKAINNADASKRLDPFNEEGFYIKGVALYNLGMEKGALDEFQNGSKIAQMVPPLSLFSSLPQHHLPLCFLLFALPSLFSRA
jgi:hypothetical protein